MPRAAAPGAGLYASYEKASIRIRKAPEGTEALGGIREYPGDAAARLPVFDFLPVIFQFWHSDEEFPGTLKFMWMTIRWIISGLKRPSMSWGIFYPA